MSNSALSRRQFSALTLGAPFLLKGRQVSSQAAHITLDPDRVVGQISPELYGNFLEHLGRCIEGGVFEEGSALADAQGFRRDVLEFLIGTKGRGVWEKTGSEREFHRGLGIGSKRELRDLLNAIDGFESFSRLCQDAFQDCLCEMTRQGGRKTSLALLAGLQSVRAASKRVPESFGEVLMRLEPVGESVRFSETFSGLAERGSPAEWVERLLEHHRKTQRRKPPNGKSPWFERFDDGSVMIRPDYRTEESGAQDDSYVHLYRTPSLWQFASDLHLIKA